MRDRNRIIFEITDLLAEYWLGEPDQRLSQLLLNLSRGDGGTILDTNQFWNIQDDVWLAKLKEQLA